MSAVVEKVPTGTRVVPLTEAVDLNPRPERGALSDDLEVSFVPMAAVEAATGRMEASAVRRFGEVKKGYTVFREGDVLFAKITPCMENGKMVVAQGLRNGLGCGSTEFHVLRPRPGVDPHYVYHFVSSARFRAEAAHHMTGAVGQKRVPAAFLEKREIPLPDLDEQRRIVAEIEKQFSRLDAAIKGLTRVKQTLGRYRTGVINTACDGRLSGCRFRANSSRMRTLAELSTAGKYGTSVKCSYENSGIPVLRIPNVVGGQLDLSDLKYAPGTYRVAEEDYLEPGDLLVVRTNGSKSLIGRGAIVVKDLLRRYVFASYLIRFRLQGGPDLWKWISLVLESSATRRWIEQHAASSAGQHNVSLTLLKSLPIPLPDEATRLRLVDEVERRFSIVAELEAQTRTALGRAARLQQSVLAGAFRA